MPHGSRSIEVPSCHSAQSHQQLEIIRPRDIETPTAFRIRHDEGRTQKSWRRPVSRVAEFWSRENLNRISTSPPLGIFVRPSAGTLGIEKHSGTADSPAARAASYLSSVPTLDTAHGCSSDETCRTCPVCLEEIVVPGNTSSKAVHQVSSSTPTASDSNDEDEEARAARGAFGAQDHVTLSCGHSIHLACFLLLVVTQAEHTPLPTSGLRGRDPFSPSSSPSRDPPSILLGSIPAPHSARAHSGTVPPNHRCPLCRAPFSPTVASALSEVTFQASRTPNLVLQGQPQAEALDPYPRRGRAAMGIQELSSLQQHWNHLSSHVVQNEGVQQQQEEEEGEVLAVEEVGNPGSTSTGMEAWSATWTNSAPGRVNSVSSGGTATPGQGISARQGWAVVGRRSGGSPEEFAAQTGTGQHRGTFRVQRVDPEDLGHLFY